MSRSLMGLVRSERRRSLSVLGGASDMGSSLAAGHACSLLFMSGNRGAMPSIVKGLAGVAAVGAGCLAYAGLYEVNAFRVRRVTVPVLPAGARDIRVLHMSDLHMTPQRELASAGSRLCRLEPDLVINTGDNLAHEDAVPFVLGSLGRLLDIRESTSGARTTTIRRRSRIPCAISRARVGGSSTRADAAMARSRPGLQGVGLDRPDPHPSVVGDQGRPDRFPRHRRRSH